MDKNDIERQSSLYRAGLENYKLHVLENTEEDYLKRKDKRDTEAVKSFVKTSSFEYIRDM
jgi:hypothetical protein